jgi:hypothetical protein
MPLTHKGREGLINLAAGVSGEDLDLQSDSVACRLRVSHCGSSLAGAGRIDEHSDTSDSRHHRPQELQPLCCQFTCEEIDACQISARPSEAVDKT